MRLPQQLLRALRLRIASYNTVREKNIRVPEDGCEDKISELSDDLLVQILLLIPTKDAMATMILSKRWRFVWTMRPNLEYRERRIFEYKKVTKNVWWFLYNSLQLHKAPVIDSLCIELGPLCPTDADVEKLVAKVFDRLVRKLDFKLRWSGDPISLPNSLYTCETLIDLKLCHKIFIDFPSRGWLPSLKKLFLCSVVYKDETSLERFLENCPVLEELLVKRRKEDNVTKFCVWVPTLLFFSYDIYLLPLHDIRSPDRCLFLDTPALKHLIIDSVVEDFCFIENMPCLDSADITFNLDYDDDGSLRSLSSVLSMCLSDVSLRCCSTINFSRLGKLRIYPYDSDWLEQLMVLLGNTPKLKHLVVDYAYTGSPEDISLSWNQPYSVPSCLSSHLEIFEWMEGYGGRVEEKDFLTYILANSKCLKRAKIILSYTFSDEKQKVMEELESISRVSKASQLLFR